MRTHLIIVPLMLGSIACTDRSRPTNGPRASPLLTGSSPEHVDHPGERVFWELARVAPSHGGWYFDTLTGDLNVYVKDMTEGPAAKRALGSLLSQGLARAQTRHPNAGILVKQGTYTFIELSRWRDTLNDFFSETPGVQWWGIDYARNRVIVGVLSGADSQAIAAKARELAVPEGALQIERTGRFESLETLRDSIRPIKGGTLLRYTASNGTIHECSLGFLALWGGAHAFVTASHCSSRELALDSTNQFQPNWHLDPVPTSIGFEVADSSMGCHCGFPGQTCPCSYADASVYRATLPPGDWYAWRIARTLYGCNPSCDPPSLTIDPTHKFWTIVRTDTLINVGDLVNKIGSFGGWTQGFVRQINMKVTKGSISYEEQVYADFQADSGDSGSPVLLDILGGADTTATLGGILSGKVVGGPNDGLSVFSPWHGILLMYPGLRVN